MAYDRFLIGPMESGLQTNLPAWQIMDDAWRVLINVYCWRGRIRKRFGSYYMGYGADSAVTAQLFSRLSIPITGGPGVGFTDAAGNASSTVPGSVFQVGQMFSIGDAIYTVSALGTPANLLQTVATPTATFDTTTGIYNFVGAPPLTQIFYFPSLPVMGITEYATGPIENHPSYAFDTQFGYVYAGGFWERTGVANMIFHGSDSDFFWSTNWIGATANIICLFTTNFHVVNPNGITVSPGDDPIWETQDGTNWLPFYPYYLPGMGVYAPTTGPFVQSARIILQFKNRLILLNTIENDNSGGGNTGNNKHYAQRCRYSHIGSPFAANAWYEPNNFDSAGNKADGAGFLDATTEEEIISAEFIKDRLIVYFETSTWELAYTGNEVRPFTWQKINTELGSQSTFSTVPFDKQVLTIGNVGVHACNGANTVRIDSNIPSEVFKINQAENGIKRVCGIRDYYTELVYWSFPSNRTNSERYFPDEILVYNYQNESWAIFEDCITAFGYFEQQQTATWATTIRTWETINDTWDSGLFSQQIRQIIAGNQEGFMFIVDPNLSRNAPVMQVTNMTYVGTLVTVTIINHSLKPYDYITLENAQGVTIPNLIYPVSRILDKDRIQLRITDFAGTYTGGGTVARVSEINMESKQWNPYLDKGQNFAIIRIEFCVERTSNGQITVDYGPSSSNRSMISDANSSTAIVGKNILSTAPYSLYPMEKFQERLWHPVYFQVSGSFIQLSMYLNEDQITNPLIAFSDFQLEALELVLQKAGRLQ